VDLDVEPKRKIVHLHPFYLSKSLIMFEAGKLWIFEFQRCEFLYSLEILGKSKSGGARLSSSQCHIALPQHHGTVALPTCPLACHCCTPEQCSHSILISFRYFPPTAAKRAALLSLVSTMLFALLALALPSHHAAACHCLVLPCLLGCCTPATRLLYYIPPKLPKPPRLLLPSPAPSTTACSQSWAVSELHVCPRARARYRRRTSHPCAGPSRTELMHRDPGAAFPTPPSSSPCYPSASPMPC
jgi:hypothetical protein